MKGVNGHFELTIKAAGALLLPDEIVGSLGVVPPRQPVGQGGLNGRVSSIRVADLGNSAPVGCRSASQSGRLSLTQPKLSLKSSAAFSLRAARFSSWPALQLVNVQHN